MNQAAREIRERTSRHEAMTEDEVVMNQIAGKETKHGRACGTDGDGNNHRGACEEMHGRRETSDAPRLKHTRDVRWDPVIL